jgi:hypothetical protein
MSFNRRLDRIEKELQEYVETRYIKKRAFALMRRLKELEGTSEAEQDEMSQVLNDLINHIGSETIKQKMNTSAKIIEKNEADKAEMNENM